ncbi:HAD family hydrolase [Baekduia soli]|uniref:D,D-heptose 1,7-bisphosphate phosphatase n=1 Tax=Baekduia soli TaxID=496014 RepID=A0A5B8U0U2_9ACTN|nr:HAD family hydrolase [Baekduia soli]QEC46654.1 HAD family hydrolase [Baekduia soli]
MLRPGGAAFLDRDGTINVKAPEGAYVERPEDLVLLPGAAQAIRSLNDAAIPVVVVTNQRGIALGRMDEVDLAAIHVRLVDLLDREAGAAVDDILHCPHDRGPCGCRKPAPGLLLAAAQRHPHIELGRSVVIGDRPSDVEAGAAAGVPGLLLGRDAEDLAHAVQHLLAPVSAI